MAEELLDNTERYKMNAEIQAILIKYLGLGTGIITHAVITMDNNDVTEVVLTIAL
jgi:hypothetical protein